MSIKDRIKILSEHNNINVSQFEKIIGVSNGYVNAISRSIGIDKIETILEKFPNINIEWLLTGKGEMLKSGSCAAPEVIKYCELCKEKDKVISAQKETISLLKDKVENLNFCIHEIENNYNIPVASIQKLKHQPSKK